MLQHASSSQHFHPTFEQPPNRSQSSTPSLPEIRKYDPELRRLSVQYPPPYQSQRSFSVASSVASSFAGGQSPALSALASLAASSAPAAAAAVDDTSNRAPTPLQRMNQQMYAPAATAGGGQTQQNGSGPPVCQNCATSTTPLWRRDESGSVLCNACGLFLKLHGRPRPISLKTDVIKSRNRVKTSQPRKRDSNGDQIPLPPHQHQQYQQQHPQHNGGPPQHLLNGNGNSEPGAHPDNLTHHQQHETAPLDQHQANPNIAPPHIFEALSLPQSTYPPSPTQPQIPSIAFRQPSPSPSAFNGGHYNHDTTQDRGRDYEALLAQNARLATRVSELEVINDLFRGRVAELEVQHEASRQRERAAEATMLDMRAELGALRGRQQPDGEVVDGERASKRVKTDGTRDEGVKATNGGRSASRPTC